MRSLFGSVVVLLSVAFATGCGSASPKAQSADDVVGAMRLELAHAVTPSDTLDAMDDELAHAIGTTTVTSAMVVLPALAAPALLDEPMLLPESRLSLSAPAEPAAPSTWGADKPTSEIPRDRE